MSKTHNQDCGVAKKTLVGLMKNPNLEWPPKPSSIIFFFASKALLRRDLILYGDI